MSERQLGETTALTPARSDRVVTGIFLSLQRSLGNVFLCIWPEVPDHSVFREGQIPGTGKLSTSHLSTTGDEDSGVQTVSGMQRRYR